MLRTIAKAVGYARAPKATYLIRHPVKGTKALLAAKGVKTFAKKKPGLATVAAVAAVPVATAWAVKKLAS